jgi:hypothetical protein
MFRYDQRGQELMGRVGSDNSNKPAEFKMDKFKIDMSNVTAVCPMGKTSEKYTEMIDGSYNIYFAYSDCATCINGIKCARKGRDHKRRLHVSKYYEALQAFVWEKNTWIGVKTAILHIFDPKPPVLSLFFIHFPTGKGSVKGYRHQQSVLPTTNPEAPVFII